MAVIMLIIRRKSFSFLLIAITLACFFYGGLAFLPSQKTIKEQKGMNCFQWIALQRLQRPIVLCLHQKQDRYQEFVRALKKLEWPCSIQVPKKLPAFGNALSFEEKKCSFISKPINARLSVALGIPLSLNRASIKELHFIPYMKSKIAQSIISHREKNGFFQRTEQLLEVRGIGKKTFQRLKPFLFVQPIPSSKKNSR